MRRISAEKVYGMPDLCRKRKKASSRPNHRVANHHSLYLTSPLMTHLLGLGAGRSTRRRGRCKARNRTRGGYPTTTTTTTTTATTETKTKTTTRTISSLGGGWCVWLWIERELPAWRGWGGAACCSGRRRFASSRSESSVGPRPPVGRIKVKTVIMVR